MAESKLEKCHQLNVALLDLWKQLGYKEEVKMCGEDAESKLRWIMERY